MNYTLRVLIRVTVTFAVLLILTRISGKKQISQSTFFDFMTAIAVGDIAGEKVSDPQYPLFPWILASALWFALIIAMDLLVLSNRKIADLVEGTPTLLVENGRILEKNLRKTYLRGDELMAHLRKKNIFNPADVEFAIFETDGSVSVQPKSQMRPVTPKDLQIPTSYEGISRELVVDGRMIKANLQEMGLSESWLRQELARLGHPRPESVFYASIDTSGQLFVDGYNDPVPGRRVRIEDHTANQQDQQHPGPH